MARLCFKRRLLIIFFLSSVGLTNWFLRSTTQNHAYQLLFQMDPSLGISCFCAASPPQRHGASGFSCLLPCPSTLFWVLSTTWPSASHSCSRLSTLMALIQILMAIQQSVINPPPRAWHHARLRGCCSEPGKLSPALSTPSRDSLLEQSMIQSVLHAVSRAPFLKVNSTQIPSTVTHGIKPESLSRPWTHPPLPLPPSKQTEFPPVLGDPLCLRSGCQSLRMRPPSQAANLTTSLQHLAQLLSSPGRTLLQPRSSWPGVTSSS